ncbi:uncharacterized protein K452DRAFT_341141 [Aplosporella prunicola CBS 121167]|uniref:Major facilitator superfamily (MFS) profile domain-containing protein n=1 Tax=Aplosporella prunicola CBS 121167 TaxID=1176127 RepID=A0A6A6B1D4_9PEZI|nr:uncharacterized protein K452DRAFT_341141 [Aplosporella prunicola CBS 121167]KAF2137398.1 hypothetical protein K452DRAFT_341141 [Aplosporella prunicola CBS 121167]
MASKTPQETPTPSTPSPDPAPDGGARAWLVAAGAASVFFCCLGFANSFGTLQAYYLTHQLRGESADAVAWIGSLGAFLQFAAGLVGGPLFDRWGTQVVRPAAVVYLAAMMLLSLCTTYWQLMLAQGVLMGLATGFLQLPAFAAVAQHFSRKRASALGLAVSGSSIGGVVLPIALSKMLNSSALSFGWSIRITAFLLLPFMAFAALALRPCLPPRTTAFWLPYAFKEPRFLLLTLALFFAFTGMFTPLFYLPSYASTVVGTPATLAGYLLAILNAASTLGRIVPGVLADRYGRLNMFAGGTLATAIVVFCLDEVRSTAALIVYAVVFGFASGTIVSGASAAFAACPADVRDVGTYMGMGMAVSALGGLIGPPVCGALVQRYGGFLEVAVFSGAMCFCGGCVSLLAKLTTPQGIWGRV